MSGNMAERFAQQYESLKGQTHFVTSYEEAAAVATAICREKHAKCLALGETSAEFSASLAENCRVDEVEILSPPYASKDLPFAIDRADVGISECAFAIVQTGTLVEIATDDAYRLVSSLPSTHIAILREEELVERLFDASARLRLIFEEHDKNCVVSFISGPSRTGDIELKLTLGVHGPREAHVIVVSEGSPGRVKNG